MKIAGLFYKYFISTRVTNIYCEIRKSEKKGEIEREIKLWG